MQMGVPTGRYTCDCALTHLNAVFSECALSMVVLTVVEGAELLSQEKRTFGNRRHTGRLQQQLPATPLTG